MYEYEPSIKYQDYVDVLERSDNVKVSSLKVARSTEDRKEKNQTDIRFCGIEQLWLETPGKAGPRDKSFFSAEHEVAAGSPSRWHFAPKEEEVKLCWELKGRLTSNGKTFANPVELKVELFTRKNQTPLWVKTIKWKAGECPKEGNIKFTGDLNSSVYKSATGTVEETTEWKDKTRFPDAVITVDGSPYKLKVSIINAGDPRFIVARWIYFDVLVDSLELKWGEASMLPKTRPDIPDTLNLQKIVGKPADPSVPGDKAKKGYEEIILEELKKANSEPVEGVIHEVKLTSNVFSFQKKQDEQNVESYQTQKDFDCYKALWGNGARIPLIVKAYIKKSVDGEKTDKVPEVMGGSQLIWDWDEKRADRWKEFLAGRSEPKTEPFLKDAFDKNAPFKPKADSNCPKEYGGKHGDDSESSLVFPEQKSCAEFPFTVEKSKGRKWSSISSFGTGENQGISAVIFQPARFAGDIYKIKAYLHFERYTDTEDDIQAPDPVQTKTCEFKVFRRINLISLRRGNPGKSPDTLEAALKNTYLEELDMYVEVKPEAVDNEVYKKALKTAISRVCRREHFPFNLVGVPYIPLVSRFAIDTQPPDGSAGVVFRNWDTLKFEIASLFENQRMRLVNGSPAGLFDEDVKSQTSGNTGTLIKIGSNSVLLFRGDAPLNTGEKIVGETSDTASALNFDQNSKSYWGWRVQVSSKTEKDDRIYEESIKVVFPDKSEVIIDYKDKSGIKRKLTADLPQTGKDAITKGFKSALANFDERGAFNVVVNARTNSSNAVNRHKNVEAFIEGLLKDPALPDRRDACQKLLNTFKGLFVGPSASKYQKGISLLLVGEIVWEYAKLQFPNAEGIFLLHIPGRYKGYSLTDTANGARQVEAKMPKVQGAFYPELSGDTNSKPFRTRDRGIAFIATVSDDDGTPTKSEESIIKHELAHGLFLPHNVNKTVKPQPASPKPVCHVKDDGCLMNYDLDTEHFCGMCMLRLRGWKWRAKFVKNVIEVKVLNGDDKTFLTANDSQYVNLPKEDKWVDPIFTKNKDRLGRKVRVMVKFDPDKTKGDRCYVQVLGHKDNSVYSDEEKGRRESFNISQEPADLASGDFDRAVGPAIEGSRDANDSFFCEVELPPSVGDRYKIIAYGDDMTPVETAEIETWRAVYYMVIAAGNTTHCVPSRSFRSVLEPAYVGSCTLLIHLGDETMVQVNPKPECAYVDAVANADFVPLVDQLCDRKVPSLPDRKYSDFKPFLARFVFVDQLPSSISQGATLPVGPVPIGPGKPLIRVPIVTAKAPLTDPTADMRKALWIGFGRSIMDGSKPTVPGNHWFINATLTCTDGTVHQIPASNCVPVADPTNDELFREIDVRVDNLPTATPTGSVSLEIVRVNRMVAGLAIDGTRGIMVMPGRMHFVAKSHANQISAAIHELGHSMGMVAEPGNAGLDAHATFYKSDGNHCWTGLTKQTSDNLYQKDPNAASSAQCLMFGFITNPPRTTFCANCTAALRKLDISGGLLAKL